MSSLRIIGWRIALYLLIIKNKERIQVLSYERGLKSIFSQIFSNKVLSQQRQPYYAWSNRTVVLLQLRTALHIQGAGQVEDSSRPFRRLQGTDASNSR